MVASLSPLVLRQERLNVRDHLQVHQDGIANFAHESVLAEQIVCFLSYLSMLRISVVQDMVLAYFLRAILAGRPVPSPGISLVRWVARRTVFFLGRPRRRCHDDDMQAAPPLRS